MSDISQINLDGIDYNIKDSNARSNITSLNTNINTLNSNITNISTELSNEITATSDEVKGLDTKVTNLNTTVTNVSNEVKELDNKITTTSSQVEDLKSSISNRLNIDTTETQMVQGSVIFNDNIKANQVYSGDNQVLTEVNANVKYTTETIASFEKSITNGVETLTLNLPNSSTGEGSENETDLTEINNRITDLETNTTNLQSQLNNKLETDDLTQINTDIDNLEKTSITSVIGGTVSYGTTPGINPSQSGNTVTLNLTLPEPSETGESTDLTEVNTKIENLEKSLDNKLDLTDGGIVTGDVDFQGQITANNTPIITSVSPTNSVTFNAANESNASLTATNSNGVLSLLLNLPSLSGGTSSSTSKVTYLAEYTSVDTIPINPNMITLPNDESFSNYDLLIIQADWGIKNIVNSAGETTAKNAYVPFFTIVTSKKFSNDRSVMLNTLYISYLNSVFNSCSFNTGITKLVYIDDKTYQVSSMLTDYAPTSLSIIGVKL